MTARVDQLISDANSRLFKALDALTIQSPSQYTFCGTTVTVPQQSQQMATTGNLPPHYAMVAALQAQLYGSVYNRHFDGRVAPGPPPAMTDMTEDLSRANRGRERWDHGWQVYQAAPTGVIQAHKEGRAQMFYPGQYMAVAGMQGAVQPGAMVSVYLAKEMRNFQEGFYIAVSENVQLWYEQATLVRVYWNVTADGAAVLLNQLVTRFNRFQVPFRFKCLAYRELYDRFDAAVLFVGRRRWSIAALIVEELYPDLKTHLKADVPLFAKPLAPGVALAEDPATGESFGTSRCRLVAEGIWNAYARGVQTERARRDDIAGVFSREGLTAERPWLSSGSVDTYDAQLD